MIYVVYNNDPLAHDQGGGAEHFRGLYRALARSGLEFRLIAARLQNDTVDPRIVYISETSHFGRFYMALWAWFWRNRDRIGPGDLFHFHRNYCAWPKLLLVPDRGRMLISYHNVTGRVLEGRLGRLAAPLRSLMLLFERQVVAVADALICVSGRDLRSLRDIVLPAPFERAHVIPAAYDDQLFEDRPAEPPDAALASRLLLLGRLSHQKNVPLAMATFEALIAQGVDATLTIAGEGEDSRWLVRRIATSPVAERIRWLGMVAHDRVPELLAEHGVLLLTSRYEASPTVVKEALRAKRPVVSTDVGDVPDWLEEGSTGFVRANEPQALVEGITAAMELIATGGYGRDVPGRQPNERAIMDEVVQLYRKLAVG